MRCALLVLVAVPLSCDRAADPAGDAAEAVEAADSVDTPPDGEADIVEDAAAGESTDVEDGDADGTVEDAAPPCVEPTAECAETACHAPPFTATCIGGTVRDENGEPLGDQLVSACIGGRCVSARSRADGWFAIRLPSEPSDSLGMHFPSDPPRLEPFCRFRALCDGPIHVCDDFRLYPAPLSGTPLPPSPPPDWPLTEDLRIEAADGAALVLPAGAVAMLPVGLPDYMALTRFPLEENMPCFIDPAHPPLALWAVTPGNAEIIEPGTMIDPVLRPAALDLPNEFGLAPGAAVEVYMVGGGHTVTGLESGEWAPVATAAVTADGARIRTNPGEGIGDLTWFGIYAVE